MPALRHSGTPAPRHSLALVEHEARGGLARGVREGQLDDNAVVELGDVRLHDRDREVRVTARMALDERLVVEDLFRLLVLLHQVDPAALEVRAVARPLRARDQLGVERSGRSCRGRTSGGPPPRRR